MILTALMECYDLLKKKYGTEAPHGIPEFGFSREQPDFCVVLDKNGEIKLIKPIEEGTVLILPTTTKSSGRTSSAKDHPHFLWDSTDYIFGARKKAKDKLDYFTSFKKLCENKLFEEIQNDEGMKAVLNFLENWERGDMDPEKHILLKDYWDRMKSKSNSQGQTIIFQLYGEHKYIPQRSAIVKSWKKHIREIEIEDNRPEKNKKKKPPVEGISLLTGDWKKNENDNLPIAVQHRKAIKGGMGAIVSFNFKAAESYGLEGNFNAPVGIDEAFKYITALNYLLEDNPNKYKVMLGSIATVFWAEKDVKTNAGLFVEETVKHSLKSPIKPSDKAPDKEKKIYDTITSKLKSFNEGLKKGQEVLQPDEVQKGNTKFYILGLEATSKGRVSVRFWLKTSIKELFQKLAKHLQDIEIKTDNFNSPSVYEIIYQLKHKKKEDQRYKTTEDDDKFRKRTSIIATDLAMSVLTGIPYPEELLWGILDRIKKDGDINFTRVSMLKGILMRNGYLKRAQQLSNLTQEALMALDEKCNNVGYVLGRLFAAYEKAQSYYHWKERGKIIDKTIRDRYYGTASTTPLAIFPTLDKLSHVHLSKSGWLLPIIEEITNLLEAKPYPAVLPPPEQALFTLGYYHEKAELRQKKREDEITPDDLIENDNKNN